MGRKSKLTQEVLEVILEEHSKGLPINSCCDLVGVSRTQFYDWVNKGEAGSKANNGLYIELYKGMKRARAECIRHYIEKAWENNSPQMIQYMLRVYDNDTFNVADKTENKNINIHSINDLFDDTMIREIADDDD